MYKKLKMIVSWILISTVILFSMPVFANNSSILRFSDVPEGHWAEKSVNDLRSLKITDGIGDNKFGLGLTIRRSEFVTYLVRLMKWELINPGKGSFIDNVDSSKWYYSSVETALENGVISKGSSSFRPDDPITREEMATMIVCALGYDSLAKQLTYLGSPFDDVQNNTGYISIARDFGIITGVGDNKFKPADTATREQAAAMMMRMYERLNQPVNELHAFYAVSSAAQADMIKDLDSVSFGWSRLEFDTKSKQIVLNTSSGNNNSFAVPEGFSGPFNSARQSKVSAQLMVFAENDTLLSTDNEKNVPLLEYILTKPEICKTVISSIVNQVNATTKDNITVSFDGVVIDFENMKGETLKQAFNAFLAELRQELDKNGKKMYVAVHPRGKPGQTYNDAYDYKTIGEIADKVILMAHDYYAKKLTEEEMQNGYTVTPLSPIDEIYCALRAITDTNTGVQDLSKIWLQISFDSVQWKLKDGKVINQYPYNPSYEAIRQRMLTGVTMNYSNLNQNPYITFYNSSDGTNNVLWYEDSRSVQAKISLARMFGIEGISLWRLGNIPDYEENGTNKLYLDVWQQIK